MQFLTFRLTNNVLVLAKSAVVPGTLKPTPAETPAAGLRVVLEDVPDSTLWSQRIPDPASRRLEYEAPEAPGVIQYKIVSVQDTEFVVRTPFYKQAQTVAVFREVPAAAKGDRSAAPAQRLVLRANLPATDVR